MKNKTIIRNSIIFIAVFILAVIGYEVFFAKKSAAPSLQTTSGLGVTVPGAAAPVSASPDVNSVGSDFLSLLLSVQSIKLDDSVLSSKPFTVLQDFNRPIPPDTNPGRQNPFAPIGADSTTVSTQVSTTNPSSITATSATLNGAVMVGGPSVNRWFEYGTTQALGSLTVPKVQQNPGAFAEPISGLLPNTTYYAKAMASINGVTNAGNIVTWKTALGSIKN